MLPFTSKYRPKTLSEVVGHTSVVERLHEWVSAWKRGEKQKPILIYGKPGVGKTCLIQSLANDYDLEILEMNASDTRTSKAVDRVAGYSSNSLTFSGKIRLILFDEIDGLFIQDRGGSASINRILKETDCPIILTANDAWNPKLSTIRTLCELLEVKKVHYATISKLLEKISQVENIIIDKPALSELAKNAQGDVRSALNDLHFLSSTRDKSISIDDVKLLSQRDRPDNNMFNVVQKVLKTTDFNEATQAVYNINQTPDFILKWISENIPKEYKIPKDFFNAMQQVSKADIFLGRVFRRQNYTFWRYANVLMTAGVALSKESKYHGFTRFSCPQMISYLSASKSGRASMKNAAAKIAHFCHVSTRTAIQDYLPMFNVLMKDENAAASFTYKLGFDEDDLDYFDIKSPKKIIEAAEELKSNIIKQEITKDRSQNSLNKFF